MAGEATSYEVRQAFWRKGQLMQPGTAGAPNSVQLTEREARYHLTAGDIVRAGLEPASQPVSPLVDGDE